MIWIKMLLQNGQIRKAYCDSDDDNLFDLLYIINKAPAVKQFVVGTCNTILNKNTFKWALEKWVMEFDYSKTDR